MADYYPLIARAIAGLDPNAPGESRRALYERARAALIAQLRSVQPPLSESEITRERLSLEEAVRKVEAEAAQRAREAQRASSGAARPGDALRRAGARNPDGPAAPVAQPGPGPDQAPSPAPRPRPAAVPPMSRDDRPPLGSEPPDARPARAPRPDLPPAAAAPTAPLRPQPPQAAAQDAPPPPVRERTAAPRRGPDSSGPAATPAMRGFRDITADVDDLGKATAQANRAARKTYANVPATELDRLDGDDDRPPLPEPPYSYDESVQEAERYALPATSARQRAGAEREGKKKSERSGSTFPFKAAIGAGIVLILIGAGILWGRPLVSAVTNLFKSSSTVEVPKDNGAPLTKPKITDRVGQAPSSDQIAPVAQRVVLYDEDPGDPKGKQYIGSVVWRTEQIKATGTQKADIAVRADIEIPDRKFKMTMSFRRNTDTSLPASHTAELTFILPQDFSGGGVGNVPGILMKSNEQSRGTPLAGLAVKVTDGFFLVGLSNVDADRTRNVQLLKERSWFDVPLVYTNQRRAIIAIEKGAPGERAFNDAFTLWGD
ncbi:MULTISPECIES: hypothetical protein [Bradyrhizobium]|jgi:hypothetical protein|uniref:Histidine kinase n=3 Tax=Bradyrhizobium TaxID=374 RepID=A0ABS5GG52_9BRAD|nr:MULTISPECIES: hypothetical protein [Bradyrhizobium]RTL97590.1 MAG: hypothetical protein EKK32_20420 [Bradyrhizobiaceae bacterium]MBR1140322.1 hypothetical protein [Bradyrhizobium denitrificans]MCL8486202.1 hypothetical protein [Bradyrhizobium denitrificans]MDU1496717.1 hypothetical protein [Bradyrhizobium sp.]MDU1547387.1 hypothetical protein [Bradyrhizobium sp.]